MKSKPAKLKKPYFIVANMYDQESVALHSIEGVNEYINRVNDGCENDPEVLETIHVYEVLQEYSIKTTRAVSLEKTISLE